MIKKSYLVCFISLPLIGMHGGDASLFSIAAQGAATEAKKNLSHAQKSLADFAQRVSANVSENKNKYTLAAGAVGAAALLGRLAWKFKNRPAAKPDLNPLDPNAGAGGDGQTPQDLEAVKKFNAHDAQAQGGDQNPQEVILAADAARELKEHDVLPRTPTPHTSPKKEYSAISPCPSPRSPKDVNQVIADGPTLQEAQTAVDAEVPAIKDLATGAGAGSSERRPSVDIDKRHRFISQGKHYVETFPGSNQYEEEKPRRKSGTFLSVPGPDGGKRPVRMGSDSRDVGSGTPGCYR